VCKRLMRARISLLSDLNNFGQQKNGKNFSICRENAMERSENFDLLLLLRSLSGSLEKRISPG